MGNNGEQTPEHTAAGRAGVSGNLLLPGISLPQTDTDTTAMTAAGRAGVSGNLLLRPGISLPQTDTPTPRQ